MAYVALHIYIFTCICKKNILVLYSCLCRYPPCAGFPGLSPTCSLQPLENTLIMQIYKRLFLVALFFLSSLPVMAWAANDDGSVKDPTKTAQEFMAKGIESARSGQIDQARTAFENATRIAPELAPMAWAGLGMALGGQGRWLEAVVEFKKVVALQPADMRAHFNLANAYLSAGERDQAIGEYRNMIELDSKLDWAHFNLASLYLQKEETSSAIEEFEKAAELNPALPASYEKLGVLYDQVGMTEKAIAAYEKAIELAPLNGTTQYNLGVVYLKNGDVFKGEAAYRKAIELMPNNAEAYNNIGTIYLSRQDPQGAIPFFLKSVELKPDLEQGLINLSVSYRDIKDFESALLYAQKAKDIGINRAQVLIESIQRKMAENQGVKDASPAQ